MLAILDLKLVYREKSFHTNALQPIYIYLSVMFLIYTQSFVAVPDLFVR